MTPLQEAATAAYATRQKALAARSYAFLADQWDRLGSYESADVGMLIDQAGPVMEAFQQQSVALSAAYLSVVQGSSPPTPDVASDIPWRDPFIAYWAKLKTVGDLGEALEAGRLRAGDTAHTVVVRASDDYVRGTTRRQVTGYRRRTVGPSCDWCNSMAGDYARDDIDAWRRHKKCDCSITPIEN